MAKRVAYAALVLATLLASAAEVGAQRAPAVIRVTADPDQFDLVVGDTAVSRLTLKGPKQTLIDPAARRDLRATPDYPEVARADIRDGRLVVTALRSGQARVKIQVGEVTGWVRVSVGDGTGAGAAVMPTAPQATSGAIALRAKDSAITLLPGESQRLEVSAVGVGDAPVAASLRFRSFDRNAADVESVTGEVTARGPGLAMIGVELPGSDLTATVRVQVSDAPLRVQTDTVHLTGRGRDTLRVVAPSLGGREYRGRVGWSSSNDSVVQVDPASGVVSARSPGSADVTARAAGRDLRSVVRVYRMPHAVMPPADANAVITLAMGGSRPAFLAALSESGKDTLYPFPARWTVADTTTARYDGARRLLMGKSTGTTRLIARSLLRGVTVDSFSWTVRVVGGGVSAGASRRGYRVGDQDSLRAVLNDPGGTPTSDPVNLTWTSDRPSVLRQSAPSTFTAMAPGRALLTGRSEWDSIVRISAIVAPDLVFPVSGVNSTGRRFATIYGYDFRNRAALALTGTTAVDGEAVVSPDRTRLAFVRISDQGRQDIWVMDAGGGDEAALTSDTLRESSPTWSRDGTRLFYIAPKGGIPRLFSVDLARGQVRSVSDSLLRIQDIALHPGGRWLVYSAVKDDQVDLSFVEVTAEGVAASSPQALFSSSRNDTDERTPRFAARTGDLYFVRHQRSGRRERVLMRYQWGSIAPERLAAWPEDYIDFAVSPDGERVVALVNQRDRSTGKSRKSLYQIDPATGARTAHIYEGPSGDTGTPAFAP